MKYETRLIWVLTITFGFVFFDRNAASFLMPFIANDLHFNNTQVGLVASALSFTWAVAAFLGGAYSDRTGNRKSFLLIAVVAFSLCSFASGLAASFAALFSTRLLMGMAEGPILPIAQSLVAIESSAAKRGHNMGVMQNFGSNLLGSFAAPLILVAVASAYNWRWAFFLSGVPGSHHGPAHCQVRAPARRDLDRRNLDRRNLDRRNIRPGAQRPSRRRRAHRPRIQARRRRIRAWAIERWCGTGTCGCAC